MKKYSGLKSGRLDRVALRLCLLLVLSGSLFIASSTTPEPARAQAEFENSSAADKAYWQERYRRLRDEAARLRKKGEVARAQYAAANRRNYRRGTNRREQHEIAIESETELKRVEAELAALPEEARMSGALPGWLREVEEEPTVDLDSPPASADDDGNDDAELDADDDSDDDDDDRPNPLYPDE